MALETRNYDPATMYGASVNINLDLGDILDSNGNEMIEFDAVASAVNYLRLANAATADAIILSCQGTADRGFEFHAADGEQILILTPVAAAVNEVTILSAAPGANPTIQSTGEADTGLDFENSESEEGLILNYIVRLRLDLSR